MISVPFDLNSRHPHNSCAALNILCNDSPCAHHCIIANSFCGNNDRAGINGCTFPHSYPTRKGCVGCLISIVLYNTVMLNHNTCMNHNMAAYSCKRLNYGACIDDGAVSHCGSARDDRSRMYCRCIRWLPIFQAIYQLLLSSIIDGGISMIGKGITFAKTSTVF